MVAVHFRYALVVFASLAVTVGCNSNNSPSSTTLSGNWSGVLQYTVNGTNGQQNVTLSLQQSGSAVTGTYSANSIGYYAGGNHAVTGTLTGSNFSGTINFEPSSNPTSCAGTVSFTGNGSGSTLTWNSDGYSSTCPIIPSTTSIVVTKQ
jgi:hypothetical protein